MPARHIDDIRKRRPLDAEGRKQVDAIKRAMNLQVALAQLREQRGLSQASVADDLGTSRPNVSRIEGETDLRLSTLERYIEALGGRLEIRAVFDDESVTLT
jgi:predicted transcriptional regulator